MKKGDNVQAYLFGSWIDCVIVEITPRTAKIFYQGKQWFVDIKDVRKIK